jgi:hypothetical protein
VRCRRVCTGSDGRHHSGALVELGLNERFLGQLQGALEGSLGFRVRAQRGRAFGGANEHLARGALDLVCIRSLRRGAEGVEVVRGDDLDDLVLLRAPDGGEVLRGRQMFLLPLALRDRLVGDVPDDVLQKRILTPLGRARVGLDREHLLAEE